jgi:hypothetical protein
VATGTAPVMRQKEAAPVLVGGGDHQLLYIPSKSLSVS